MKIEHVESELSESSDHLQAIEAAIARIHRSREGSEHAIAALQKRLPDLLAERAMGDDTVQGEIDRLKTELRRHTETVEDAEPTLAGLKALCTPLQAAIRELARRIKRLEKLQTEHDEIKEQIENPSSVEIAPSRIERLHELAAKLGLESAAVVDNVRQPMEG